MVARAYPAPAHRPVLPGPVKGSAPAAISVSGVVKHFGATRALDHLDLTVRAEEVHGFLGPNGEPPPKCGRCGQRRKRGVAMRLLPHHSELAHETRPIVPAAAAATDAAIEVSHLRKTYGPVVAVDDVSFSVREGEIFGILGPNGAGKTTTVECVIGLRTPTRA